MDVIQKIKKYYRIYYGLNVELDIDVSEYEVRGKMVTFEEYYFKTRNIVVLYITGDEIEILKTKELILMCIQQNMSPYVLKRNFKYTKRYVDYNSKNYYNGVHKIIGNAYKKYSIIK